MIMSNVILTNSEKEFLSTIWIDETSIRNKQIKKDKRYLNLNRYFTGKTGVHYQLSIINTKDKFSLVLKYKENWIDSYKNMNNVNEIKKVIAGSKESVKSITVDDL